MYKGLLFDFDYTLGDSTEGIFKVLELWDMSREDILYVGDSLVDARTAQAAGVDFEGVTTGTTQKEELQEYPHVGVYTGLEEIKL